MTPGEREALAEWGLARDRIDELLGKGVLEQTSDAGAGVV